MLRDGDNFLLLAHRSPDGDTLGSAAALCRILHKSGKHAALTCADPIPKMLEFLTVGLDKFDFEPDIIIAVDVASPQLLGAAFEHYADNVDICIDHHKSNKLFAKNTYLDITAAATAEIIYDIAIALNVDICGKIAEAIYTGVVTDTGCFRFPNTSDRSHRIAAELMVAGVDAADINDRIFNTKSRACIEAELMIMDTLEFYLDGKAASITISLDTVERSGVEMSELDSMPNFLRQIEGVLVGASIKQSDDNQYRVSLRTRSPIDASAICAKFGGGGHAGAAGCVIDGDETHVKAALVKEIENYLAAL